MCDGMYMTHPTSYPEYPLQNTHPYYAEEDLLKAFNNANLYEALLNVGFTRLRKPNRDLFETWDGTPGGGRRHILRIRLSRLQP
jgi:hypothetical protein